MPLKRRSIRDHFRSILPGPFSLTTVWVRAFYWPGGPRELDLPPAFTPPSARDVGRGGRQQKKSKAGHTKKNSLAPGRQLIALSLIQRRLGWPTGRREPGAMRGFMWAFCEMPPARRVGTTPPAAPKCRWQADQWQAGETMAKMLAVIARP